ncbi:MAG TPA: carboxypeptidase regulatory-like domain-containing protein [Spirochaetales bacterium]|nr:carboxypeptidase regulatory-like domain-containing protein [Spirochaetales bacterium]
MKKFLKITTPILLVALVLLSSCDIFSMFAKKGTVTGVVYSSAAGHPRMEGVKVTASGSSASATTNSNGEFTIELPAGQRTLHFKKSGYQFTDVTVTVVADDTTAVGEDIVGYPELTSGQYRIVLTWGENPRDLDSHLLLPDGIEDVYYSHKVASDSSANLDWDDTTSYGPETVTIVTQKSGDYYYSVYHFAGSGYIGTSSAVVKVYNSSGLQKTYTVSSAPGASTSTKRWWQVFKLNGSTITPINQLADSLK